MCFLWVYNLFDMCRELCYHYSLGKILFKKLMVQDLFFPWQRSYKKTLKCFDKPDFIATSTYLF